MSEERMMILKMLDEGKITLEEADALLEALGMGDEQLNEKFKTVAHDYEEHDEDDEEDDDDEDEFENLIDEIDDEFDRMQDELEELEDDLEEHIDELEERLEEIIEDEELDDVKKAEMTEKIQSLHQNLKAKYSQIEERRKNLKEREKEYKKEARHQNDLSFDLREGLEEISRGIEEFVQSFQKEGKEDFKNAMREVGEQINEGIKEMRKGLAQGTQEVRQAFKKNDFKNLFNNILSSIGIGGFHGINVEEDITGTFDFAQAPILIEFKTNNGRIEIVGTDKEEYTLHLKYLVPANDEKEAWEMRKDLVEITQEANLLRVVTTEYRHGGVSLRLAVPKQVEADFRLKTSNGRIVVHGLQNSSTLDLRSSNGQLELGSMRVKELKGHTSNGRIEVKDFVADQVDIATSNGSIFVDGICQNIEAITSNGTISVYPRITDEGHLELRTSNGRVKVVVPQPEVGVDIDASTTMGSLSLDFPELDYRRKIEKNMRHEYQAKSKNYDNTSKHLQITARTSMGSIYIGKSDV